MIEQALSTGIGEAQFDLPKEEPKKPLDPIEDLKSKIGTASVAELSGLVNAVAARVRERNPYAGAHAYYSKLGEAVPYFIPSETQKKLSDAHIAGDTAAFGTLTLLYAKSIMKGISSYKKYASSDEELDEMTQTVVSSFITNGPKVSSDYPLHRLFHHETGWRTAKYLAEKEGVSVGFILSGDYKSLEILEKAAKKVDIFTSKGVSKLASALAARTGTSDRSISYIENRFSQAEMPVNDYSRGYDETFNAVAVREARHEILEAVEDLRESDDPRVDGCREREVIERRFGLGDRNGNKETLAQIACEVSPRVTSARIGQVEDRALRRLRRIAKVRGFKGYWDVGLGDETQVCGIRFMGRDINPVVMVDSVFPSPQTSIGDFAGELPEKEAPSKEVVELSGYNFKIKPDKNITPEMKQLLLERGVNEIGDIFSEPFKSWFGGLKGNCEEKRAVAILLSSVRRLYVDSIEREPFIDRKVSDIEVDSKTSEYKIIEYIVENKNKKLLEHIIGKMIQTDNTILSKLPLAERIALERQLRISREEYSQEEINVKSQMPLLFVSIYARKAKQKLFASAYSELSEYCGMDLSIDSR